MRRYYILQNDKVLGAVFYTNNLYNKLYNCGVDFSQNSV